MIFTDVAMLVRYHTFYLYQHDSLVKVELTGYRTILLTLSLFLLTLILSIITCREDSLAKVCFNMFSCIRLFYSPRLGRNLADSLDL